MQEIIFHVKNYNSYSGHNFFSSFSSPVSIALQWVFVFAFKITLGYYNNISTVIYLKVRKQGMTFSVLEIY